MIDRRPGSWAGSDLIAARYTAVSASSSATKAARLSSAGDVLPRDVLSRTGASVCQPVPPGRRAPAGPLHPPALRPAHAGGRGEDDQGPFCRTHPVTSNSGAIDWTVERISVRMKAGTPDEVRLAGRRAPPRAGCGEAPRPATTAAPGHPGRRR